MAIDLFHFIEFIRENTGDMDVPPDSLLDDVITLLRRHPQRMDAFESILLGFILPHMDQVYEFNHPRIDAITHFIIKRFGNISKQYPSSRIYEESVFPFLDKACDQYHMDRHHLDEIISDPRVAYYLKVGFAKFLILIRYWGMHHLRLPEQEVVKIIRAAIPGIISVRLIDLATDHHNASFCPMLIPLLSMFYREIQEFVGPKFMEVWWPVLVARQAKAEQDELEARWRIMPEEFYSNALLGNKALTTAILFLPLLHRCEQMEHADTYIEITKNFVLIYKWETISTIGERI